MKKRLKAAWQWCADVAWAAWMLAICWREWRAEERQCQIEDEEARLEAIWRARQDRIRDALAQGRAA